MNTVNETDDDDNDDDDDDWECWRVTINQIKNKYEMSFTVALKNL
jgi:hypothetical protein